jgi:hypothetical protein
MSIDRICAALLLSTLLLSIRAAVAAEAGSLASLA